LDGQALEFDWSIGSGTWTQAKYSFPSPVDLSGADIIGLSLKGGGTSEPSNDIRIMVADQNGVFYGYMIPGGINRVNRSTPSPGNSSNTCGAAPPRERPSTGPASTASS
jgi:hypothetical protein